MSLFESTTRHPGDAEYAAAAAAMQDTYGRPVQGEGRYRGGRLVSTYAVGDTISWLTPEGYRQGVVIEVLDEEANTYHVVERRGSGARIHHAVDGDAIRPF